MNLYHLKIQTVTRATIMIYDDETKTEVEGKANKAIQKGDMVTWMNGTKQWSDLNPILAGNDSNLGYVWHQDGNRIKCEKITTTITTDGTVSKTANPARFVDYLKVFN